MNFGSTTTLANYFRKPIVLTVLGAMVLLTAILSAATTERFSWYRQTLEAADGVSLEIAYQTQPNGREVRAQPLWVRVTGERLTGTENVKVFFENYYLASNASQEQQQMAAALNLSYSGEGQYSVNLGSVPIWYSRDDGSEQRFRQQISITIDGQPLRSGAGEAVFHLKLPR